MGMACIQLHNVLFMQGCLTHSKYNHLFHYETCKQRKWRMPCKRYFSCQCIKTLATHYIQNTIESLHVDRIPQITITNNFPIFKQQAAFPSLSLSKVMQIRFKSIHFKFGHFETPTETFFFFSFSYKQFSRANKQCRLALWDKEGLFLEMRKISHNKKLQNPMASYCVS